MKKTGSNTVIVTGLHPDSLLKDTNVRDGTVLLAVNGEAVHTANQASEIIRGAYTRLEFTTLLGTSRPSIPPFCYLEVAPTSKLHPGITFDSCCDRTMVMISQVFITDLTKTRLRVGDIVLAVNGIPVWKPHDADCEQVKAARNSHSLVLYCVAMDALRDHFAIEADSAHMVNSQEARAARVTKIKSGTYLITEGPCRFYARVDAKTQLLEDITEWEYRIKAVGRDHTSKDLCKRISYKDFCRPAFLNMNKWIEEQLEVLKREVVEKAWSHLMNKPGDTTTEETTYIVPSAPTAPTDRLQNLPIATAFAVSDD